MKRFIFLLLLGLCCVPARSAWCQTCSVTATGLAFGASYRPLSGFPVTSTATLTVTCMPGQNPVFISYQMQLGAGTGLTFANRSLTGTSTPLRYQIYSDVLNTLVWGDGTSGTVTVSDSYLLGGSASVARPYTCYAKIPGGQAVTIGSYTDMIPVLISY